MTPANPSASFTGQAGHTYGFYSIATDNAGNVQPTPTAAQQTVQIVSALSVTSIAAVSPNPRNTAVSTIDVTFSEPINPAPSPPPRLTLTDNGDAVTVTSASRFASVSGTTYQINGLAGFTKARRQLHADRERRRHPGPERQPRLGIALDLVADGHDARRRARSARCPDRHQPQLPGLRHRLRPRRRGSPSGVKSYTIYVSHQRRAWRTWTTVPGLEPHGDRDFTGQSNTTYAFYSIGHRQRRQHPGLQARRSRPAPICPT